MTNITDAEALALGKRWTACEGWRWMPGMVSMPDEHGRTWRFVRRRQVSCSILFLEQEDGPKIEEEPLPWELRPDLRDPATVGCCESLLAEASCCGAAMGHWWNGGDEEWAVWPTDGGDERLGAGRSKAEALTAAWEAVHSDGASKETRQ